MKGENGKKELKRDPSFLEELSAVWGVQETPRSYRRGLRKVYDSLPRELTVRRRPMGSFLRGAACAAAACAAAFAVLFCFDLTEPETAERIPGMGGVFYDINALMGRHPQETENSGPELDIPSFSGATDAFSELPVTDNGYSLSHLARSGNTVSIEVMTPYLGRMSCHLLRYQNTRLLGTVPRLRCSTGTYLPAGDSLQAEDESSLRDRFGMPLVNFPLSTEGKLIGYVFELPEPLPDRFFLTFYEGLAEWYSEDLLPEEDFRSCPGCRVTAEFEVNMDGDRITAKPSRTYSSMGMTRLDPEDPLKEDRDPGFFRGWLTGDVTVFSQTGEFDGMSQPQTYSAYYKVEVFSEKDELPTLTFSLDQTALGKIAPLRSPEETGGKYEIGRDTFLGENIGEARWFGNENGYWSVITTDPGRTGKAYRRWVFGIPACRICGEDSAEKAEELLSRGDVCFGLLSGETGECLIADLKEKRAEEEREFLLREQGKAVSGPAAGPGVSSEAEGNVSSGRSDPLAETEREDRDRRKE